MQAGPAPRGPLSAGPLGPRRRICCMRWWPALLVITVVAGCGAGDERPQVAGTPTSVPERGFAFDLPDGWHLSSESQTPALTNPVEILSAGTVPFGRPDKGPCAHIPTSALERIGPQDAFVTVQERYGAPQFPQRPEPFPLPPRSEGTDTETCARNGTQLDIHWFVFGSDAPPERRAEAVDLLDSLRFEPAPEGASRS